MKKAPQPGSIARHVIPRWCYTREEVAQRLGVSAPRVSSLLKHLGLLDQAATYPLVRSRRRPPFIRPRVLAITPTMLQTIMRYQYSRLRRKG